MSTLTPFERFDDLVPSALGDSFRRMLRNVDWPSWRAPGEMRVDVAETDHDYEIRAEIPGARKEDIKVSVNGDRVSIDADVKSEAETQGNGGRSLLQELYYGHMSRSFTLGCDVDDSKAKASFENGILNMTLPKQETSRQKQIRIL
jgi:HSP20 family protein